MEHIAPDTHLGSFTPETERFRQLDLPPDVLEQLLVSLRLHQQHARLVIRLEEHAFPMARFGAVQWSSGYTGKLLTQTEIAKRAERVLELLIPFGWQPLICVGEAGGFRMDVVTDLLFEA